jgi:hypothetical protein
MRKSTSLGWASSLLVCLILFGAGIGLTRAQTNPFLGQWRASEPDHDVVITLTIGEDISSLIFPGLRQNGSSQALNLAVRNLMTNEQAATFTVDLPENEGALDFEFRTAAGGMGTLRILRIDGETAIDIPPWTLGKAR